jgi:hypothetical protein
MFAVQSQQYPLHFRPNARNDNLLKDADTVIIYDPPSGKKKYNLSRPRRKLVTRHKHVGHDNRHSQQITLLKGSKSEQNVS